MGNMAMIQQHDLGCKDKQASQPFTDEKSSTTFQDPRKSCPEPFRSPRMFKYEEKTALSHNIQSAVHCRKFSIKDNVDVSCSEFR